MAERLTREKRARRYLQASMNAGYTGLPAEHREAYEEQMRAHERAYAGVREHALAGADSDFDKPLAAGEREHQRSLREKEGLKHAEVLKMRRQLRAQRSQRPSTLAGRARAGAAPGARAARRGASSATNVIGTATGGSGNTVLYFIGVALGLSLLYLLVAGKGSKALGGITAAVVGGVGAFVAPKDPIAALERSLGATPVSSAGASTSSSALSGGEASPAGHPGQQIIGTRVTTNKAGGPVEEPIYRKASYVPPFAGATPGRIDMGQDFSLKAGAPIRAIGPGKVTAIVQNWYQGQPLVAYQLTGGPAKGRTIYVAEQITPAVKVGQALRAGDVIGHYASSGTGIETGWGASGGRTLAQATTGYVEGQATAAGKSFESFLSSLGV